MKNYIIALDQGTTSSRAIVFDKAQNMLAVSQKEFTQFFPQAGYVEHDPLEIWETQKFVMLDALDKSGVRPEEIAAIGITNQRETTIVWDRETGRPVYNAIVWQCRRTAPICEQLKRQGLSDYIRQHTGLVVDAYFSGTKLKWILDHVPGAREKARQGRLLFGTVESWLIWNLTGGAVHVSDVTNASRTMLFDIRELCWDKTICDALDIPMEMLPEVRGCSEIYGYAELAGVRIPIAGCAGDQQAALFGQTCFEPGEAKNTYGTGCFLLMNTGGDFCLSDHGLVTTIASGLDGKICYAMEGSVFVGGAVIQWIRDELGLIEKAADSEFYAAQVPDNGGVYIVPAFTGLGAPHWDMYARGTIVGLTRGSGRCHLIRAALEAIAYQSHDVIEAMQQDTGIPVRELKVDGGACANNFLMQFQADITGAAIRRPKILETTALGAAFLAGLAVGVWKNTDEIRAAQTADRLYQPWMDASERRRLLAGWQKAVGRSKSWAE